MVNSRLPKHALNYKPRGRRDRGRPRKRWQCIDAGTGQRPNPWRKIMMMMMMNCDLCHCHFIFWIVSVTSNLYYLLIFYPLYYLPEDGHMSGRNM